MHMSKDEFIQAANEFSSDKFHEAYMENVQKSLSPGALNIDTDLDYAALRAIALLTAESFVNPQHKPTNKMIKTLRAFI
jgi:hypothetical protein